ncbi:2-succinyl-6-hydroxy-2,4-cyclohexadiene-1-carboxylate synthase [Leuconostoc rapi]|uniref:2-succinyl-6-hydroxy-2, 4-cyclohexadiene-1-carboxylate synthase n=1 Tax=Leuconostoc rapi TaxID=1406906 RepID=UPI0019564795|nr:2-succinyl-6-hydroxy-2,4-cyclohexadiene-1-carboxylate synthase [Leuconostoc rapi]MBM7435030.1 2-succinyl-6-hydroxy-2,4-cyclohexadiene-1-carboxylate synthase [Leuconostoc rapi]
MRQQVITVNGYAYHILRQRNDDQPMKWLLLHGFMGSHHDFDAIIQRLPGEVMTFDLLGFGPHAPYVDDVKRFTMASQIDDILAILNQVGWSTIQLLGYSMGGRLALGFAMTVPNRVANLYLESTSAGLRSESERAKRRIADVKKSELINTDFQQFVSVWEKLPLFATQNTLTTEQQAQVREQRLSQKSQNMANSLIYMGTGVQENFWPSLPQLQIPTVLIAGELDEKFKRIADDMAALAPCAQVNIIKHAGHNTHLEQPKQFIEVIKNVSH